MVEWLRGAGLGRVGGGVNNWSWGVGRGEGCLGRSGEWVLVRWGGCRGVWWGGSGRDGSVGLGSGVEG